MTNIVELKNRLSRNPAFTAAYNSLPTAAPQQSGNVSSNTITLQRALQDGVTAAQLRAVAARNWRKGQPRNIAQAKALYEVADKLEAHNGAELHREAA